MKISQKEFPDLAILFGSKESVKKEDILTNNIQLFIKGGSPIQEVKNKLCEDVSNTLWQGIKGKLYVAGRHEKVLTMDGFENLMKQSCINETISEIGKSFESIVLDTEKRGHSQVRFLFATQSKIDKLTEYYKYPLLRGQIIDEYYDYIDIGSSKILLIPVKRFEDTACFPKDMQDKMFLIDIGKVDYYLDYKEKDNIISVEFSIEPKSLSSSGIIKILK